MNYAEAVRLKKFGRKILGEDTWAKVVAALTPEGKMGLGPRITGKGPVPDPIPLVVPEGRRKSVVEPEVVDGPLEDEED